MRCASVLEQSCVCMYLFCLCVMQFFFYSTLQCLVQPTAQTIAITKQNKLNLHVYLSSNDEWKIFPLFTLPLPSLTVNPHKTHWVASLPQPCSVVICLSGWGAGGRCGVCVYGKKESVQCFSLIHKVRKSSSEKQGNIWMIHLRGGRKTARQTLQAGQERHTHAHIHI